MFSNFLYFLVALILFTSSDLIVSSREAVPNGLLYAGMLMAGFALLSRALFRRLLRHPGYYSHSTLDHGANQIIAKLSFVALILYGVNIYALGLRSHFVDITLFEKIPTLEALIFLALFLGYLSIIWSNAYGVQKRYLPARLTRRAFVVSNISFALPALLPWFCLSLFADLIEFLPLGPVTAFLRTPFGEVCYIVFFLVAVAVFGPVLIRRLWRSTSLEAGEARRKIEHVCREAGLKYADILKWELFGGSMITAGVMGLVGRFRYILVTPALLSSLEDDEVEAVILHEIGHVHRRHMVIYLLFFMGFAACNFMVFEPVMLLLYIAEPVYGLFDMVGVEKTLVHPILLVAFLVVGFVLYFRFAFGYLMRNCERQADLHQFSFGKDGSALISTFYKIASLSRQPIEKKNWHHYGIGDRIDFLKACRKNPGLIQGHHRRVRNIVLAYAAVMITVFALGYSIQYGPGKVAFGNYITEQILAQELEVDPENSELYVAVGDYYYGREEYGRAKDAYENVIRIDGRNVHALNNLAWLLATCPDPVFQDRKRALELAGRAVEIKREAFVLDTYAEALFLNERLDEAVQVAEEALSLARDKQSYYRDQLERFVRMRKAI